MNKMMNPEIGTFLRENIELLKRDDYTELYKRAQKFWPDDLLGYNTGEMTDLFYYSDVNPLLYFKEEVPENFLANSESVSKVVVPEGIVKLNFGCFSSPNIKEITLPSSLTTICNFAFALSSIKELVIPDNVTSLPFNILLNCSLLKKVSIGKNTKLSKLYIGSDDVVLEFRGTIAEYKALHSYTASDLEVKKIICSDGELKWDILGETKTKMLWKD